MYDFPNTLINMTRRTKLFAVLMFLHNRRANRESFSHYSTGLTLAHRLRPSIKLTFLVSWVGLCIFQETSTILLWYIWLLFQYVILFIDKIDYRTTVVCIERLTTGYPSKHNTLNRCCFNVGPPSAMLARHWNNIGSMSYVCWTATSVNGCHTDEKWANAR